MRFFVIALGGCILATSGAWGQREYGFDNRKSSGQPYLSPQETVARMKVPSDFEVKLFAGEPQVVNPIAFTVDEKGRVWVVECFEYPKRTVPGKMPRDRIVILEDTDGDGFADRRIVFAEGKDFPLPFDLASGIEVGHGGVYLGAPPYLWFLQDTNNDGKADKFEILLKGFGSQDTHETLNTFQWGPDGWLYGLHGVFTHSEVKPAQADGPGVRINAAVWRYHPKSKAFEVFSEGTSNPWGMDWRNTDGQFILACCVIPHLYHMVPGGIYRRQAGSSFNPYAYSEIKEICDHTFHKESGWAHAGLISLDTPLMPERFRQSVIFGSIHGCSVKQNILRPKGSTYVASRGEDFLQSGDKNFRPINLKWGPNGEIYLIDWHDQNPCHQAALDSWDYERGRVYRICRKDSKPQKAQDLSQLSDAELVQIYLKDPNPYRYRTALRLLLEHGSLKAAIQALAAEGQSSPRRAWLLSALGYYETLKPEALKEMLAAYVKAVQQAERPFDEAVAHLWTLRRLGDTKHALEELMPLLTQWAGVERSPLVRSQLASFALRHAREKSTAELLHALLKRSEDAQDPMLPVLLWLAYEKRLGHQEGATTPTRSELDWLAEHAPGNALLTDFIVPRTMRRLIATGQSNDLAEILRFVHKTKDKDGAVRRNALVGLVEALRGRQVDAPMEWKTLQAELLASPDAETVRLARQLGVHFRDDEVVRRALTTAPDTSKTPSERGEAIRALGLMVPPEAVEPLLQLATTEPLAELRTEAIRALAGFAPPEIARRLLQHFAQQPPAVRSEIVLLLAGRREWAKELLTALEQNRVARTEVTDNAITRIQAFRDQELNRRIEKAWGRLRPTPAELHALIDKMRGELQQAPGSIAKGRLVFENTCAKCHKFDGRGQEVGPPLDGAGRDIEYLLANILDPNRVIGAPYFIRTVELKNGRVESGLLQAEDGQTLTLKVENAVLKTFAKKDIEEVTVQEKSMMPEGLSNTMSVQDFRDLVRYVMAHPFLTDGTLNGQPLSVGVTGRIALPASSRETVAVFQTKLTAATPVKTRLMLGANARLLVTLNGKAVYQGTPNPAEALADQVGVEVDLPAGESEIVIKATYTGDKAALYARLLDPDRKLTLYEHPRGK